MGANMHSSQAPWADVWQTLLEVDGTSGDAGRRPATG